MDPQHEPTEPELTLAYQRPQDAWVCGWAASGTPCHSGPGARGTCPARSECVPHRQGDRWQCSRASAAGGACEEGPAPDGSCSRPVPRCQPVRSLRARRGILALAAGGFSLGLILLLTGTPSRRDLLSPGTLTFKHGTIIERCEACHTAAPETMLELAAHARTGHKDAMQTRLCLDCHEMGDQPTGVHGLPHETIAELTRRASSESAGTAPLLLAIARRTTDVPRAADGSLACGTCHHEHQGAGAVLGAMSNQQCQACHQQQFASLADGHPPFRGYPYRRRTALYFDHESHLGRHFRESASALPAGAAGESCLLCHALDRTGQMMIVKSFDETCANCHLSEITDATLGGIRVLNLPALDVERLVKAKTPPGEWPVAAAGELSPLMTLLLAERGNEPPTIQRDLTDLRPARPEEIDAAADLAWKIKGLLFDLLVTGDQALQARLKRLTNPPLTSEQVTLMIGDLAPSTVRTAQEKWLPNLRIDVPAHRAGQPLPAAAPSGAVFQQPESVRWKIDSDDCSLQYLPRRHSDLFLQTWLDVAGREYARSPAFAQVFDVLASPYGAGRCTKCHSVESRPDGSRFVHWASARPKANVHAFTTFVHAPHFSLLGGRRCNLCHSLAEGTNYSAGFVEPDHSLNIDATTFASNFHAIEKATCAECHTAGRAPDSCLQCHNYHVGTFTSNRMPIERFVTPGTKTEKRGGN